MVHRSIRFAAVLLALAITALTGACRGDAPDEVRSDRDRAVPVSVLSLALASGGFFVAALNPT